MAGHGAFAEYCCQGHEFADHRGPLRRACSVHLDAGQLRQLQHCGANAACSSVDQHALTALSLGRSMQHLIRGDVIQNNGDGFPRVESRRYGDEFALGHTHILRVAPVDGHRGDCLAQFEVRHTFAHQIDGTDKIPPRRVRHAGRFRMDALARQ